jgi:translation elongation factor P/translation initiation factor 5A
MVKVIASSLRKGNVVDQDGKLYIVLSAENIHPARARRSPSSTCAASPTA